MRLKWIGTGILEVCKRPECVADQCFGSGRVEGDRKGGLTRLAPESWKSVRGQNMLQTSALGRGRCKELKRKSNSIGTRVLDVYERPECVADEYIKFRRVQRGKYGATIYWHQNPGSLRKVRKCCRKVLCAREGARSEKCLNSLYQNPGSLAEVRLYRRPVFSNSFYIFTS